MSKKKDKIPVNIDEDLTLPNLEEGLTIEEIPSIEDLISLDKDEIEKIQETEIAGVFNSNEDTSNVFDENIDIAPLNNNADIELNHQFDTNFDNMNLFDEDTPLALDEPLVQEKGLDNDLSFNEPEISEENNISDSDDEMTAFSMVDEPVISFNDDTDMFAEDQNPVPADYNLEIPDMSDEPVLDFNDNEEPSAIELNEDVSHVTPEDDITFEPEEGGQLVADDDFTHSETQQEEVELGEEIQYQENNLFEHEQILPQEENITQKPEELNEDIISVDRTEEVSEEVQKNEEPVFSGVQLSEEPPKHTRTTEDVFAKIDSLLNDDSAFESEKTTLPPVEKTFEQVEKTFEPVNEMPKPKYRSSFNPAKYLKKDTTSSVADKEDKLGILYTATRKVIDNIKNFSEELSSGDNPSIAEMLASETGKKALVTAAVCVVVLGAGIGGVALLNNKSVEEIETISKNDTVTPLETPQQNVAEPAVPTEAQQAPLIDENANVASDAPDINQIEAPKPTVVKQDVVKEEVKKQTKPQNPESYLSVKKIQWQVPDYLSYSPNINAYLQSAGKSIKLGLSSDLLLATEYAYSNVVKINLKLTNSGAVQNATVATSSGSKEIDNIVLQSVKTTLNVVKPPAGEIKTPDFNLTITIYL